MNKQSFIRGTMILLIAGIINRILGFIPRIALPRIIGAEGVGLYQLGYPFFIVVVTIISGGIPLAVAKLVAEAESQQQPERSKHILRSTLLFSISIGFLFTFLSLICAPWVTSHIVTDSRVYHTFISMSPMIVIVAVSSVYRGYFQGKQNMIPSAISSILETVARIIGMLWFSYLLLPMGIAYAAAGAMLGVVLGEIIGLLVLMWQYRMMVNREPQGIRSPTAPVDHSTSGPILQRILRTAIPVTGGRLVGSLSYLIESITTTQSLALAGIATAVATTQYGALQGMIIPLLLLPGALTSSLAVSLVPSLADAKARGDLQTIHKRMHQSIRLALVTGAPFAVIMFVLAEPLCLLLYKNTEIANMLKMMAPFALFLYVQAPLQAALQALDKPGIALTNTLIGAVIKIVLILYLASNPLYGIYGAIMAIMANMIVVTILHSISVAKALKFYIPIVDVIKVTANMILMAGTATYCFHHIHLGNQIWLQLTMATLLSTVIYLLLSILLGLIRHQDIQRVPYLGKWFR